jgi:hypothetical protein
LKQNNSYRYQKKPFIAIIRDFCTFHLPVVSFGPVSLIALLDFTADLLDTYVDLLDLLDFGGIVDGPALAATFTLDDFFAIAIFKPFARALFDSVTMHQITRTIKT